MPPCPTRFLAPILLVLAVVAPARSQDVRWEQLPHLPGADSVFAVSDIAFSGDTLLAAASGQGLLRLAPGAPAWEVLFYDAEAVVVAERGALVVQGFLPGTEGGSGLWRSADGGQSWARVSETSADYLWRAAAGPHTAALFAAEPLLRRSTDGGLTWAAAAVPSPSPSSYDAFLALPAGAAGEGALLVACIFGVMRSADGGATWLPTPIYGVNEYSGRSLAGLGGGGVVAAMSVGGVVFRSRDGGRTWSEVGSVGEPARVVQAGPSGGGLYAVGIYSGVTYRSADEGATWDDVGKVYEGEELFRVRKVVAGPDGHLYAAANAAGPATPRDGVYRTVEPVAVTVDAEDGGPARDAFELGTPYPNPSGGGVTVAVTLGQGAEVRVGVFDVLGRRVAVLWDGPLAAGAHALRLDGAALPAGLYVVRAEVDGERLFRQTTLLR